jgi:hypothetical protein
MPLVNGGESMKEIPQGLRVTYRIYFIYALVLGLAGVFAPRLVGDIAGHPVRDIDVNMMLGATGLTFALGAWYATRAVRWDQISILTAMQAFLGLASGIAGIVVYFVPGLIGTDRLPPVQLLVAFIFVLFGAAFAYFYASVQGWTAPLARP